MCKNKLSICGKLVFSQRTSVARIPRYFLFSSNCIFCGVLPFLCAVHFYILAIFPIYSTIVFPFLKVFFICCGYSRYYSLLLLLLFFQIFFRFFFLLSSFVLLFLLFERHHGIPIVIFSFVLQFLCFCVFVCKYTLLVSSVSRFLVYVISPFPPF